jgi:hypothetical protein
MFFVFFSGASALYWALASPRHSFEAHLSERTSPKPKQQCGALLIQKRSGLCGLASNYAAADVAIDWR